MTFQVPIHHYKNYGFAELEHTRVRVVLPKTKREDNTGAFDARWNIDLRVQWCDELLLPAINQLLTREHGWPVSYRACLANARTSTGQLVLRTIDVKHTIMDDLIATLRRMIADNLETFSIFEDFFMYWDMQDEKQYTTCNFPTDIEVDWVDILRDRVFPLAMRELDIDLVTPYLHQLRFDTAVEYGHRTQSLYMWKSHHKAISRAMFGFTERRLEQFISSNSQGAQYQCDNVAGIQQLAGFHVNFKGKLTPTNIEYAQFYHTDKKLRYQSRGTDKQAPLPELWLLSPPDRRKHGFDEWVTTTEEILTDAAKTGLKTVVRMEITVPGDAMYNVIPLVDFHDLTSTFGAFDPEDMMYVFQ